MKLSRRLFDLRSTITLLNDEIVFEGWAAEREWGSRRLPGLVILTNWRIMALDLEGGMSAIPISRISEIASAAPANLAVHCWYERMVLYFDGPDAKKAVVKMLAQRPGWDLLGLKPVRAEPVAQTAEMKHWLHAGSRDLLPLAG